MPIDALFANHRRELAPGLTESTAAIRDRQLYSTTASDPDPGAADRVEVESSADVVAAMAIEKPKHDMPMTLERGRQR